MLGRFVAAVAIVAGIASAASAASAQDAKPPEIDFGRYHALVIGNNDYQQLPKLETAVNDATAVAELLRERYGFEVKLLVDATRLDILRALNDYRRDLTERDNLLIYYAGHGVLDAGTGFWLPVDAAADRDEFWIANADLTRRLKAVSAKHVLVVADSCYSGTLLREARAALPSGAERAAWLRRMNSLASRTALVSGGLEPVVDSGADGHSVFANAFLAALRDNTDVLDAQALFTKVSRPVVLNADQTPRYSDIRQAGHEGGEFLFVPLDISVSVTVQTPPTGQADREVVFWQSIQDSDDPADFKAYLEAFPEGTFVPLVRTRMKAAEQKQTALMIPPMPTVEIDPVEAEYVAVKNANVRAEPTVRSAKVTTLKRGAQVHVAGKVKDENWYLVERGDKPLGYVFGGLLKDAASVRQEEEARQKEAERERAEEAKRREGERKRAEQSKLALAPPPKPQVPSTTQPAVGVYPSARQPGDTFRDCADCPEMVAIPAGSFTMGSATNEKLYPGRSWSPRRRGPPHQVTFARAFALGKHEVTYDQWRACLRDGGCTHRPRPSKSGREPVTWVNWDQAKAYVRWLSRKTGQEYRLPSEAEWEYAARQANGLRLQGIEGDVWEWVEDCWNNDYNGAPSDGSAWTTGECSDRVLRSDSWLSGPGLLRAIAYYSGILGYNFVNYGFRIARTLP